MAQTLRHSFNGTSQGSWTLAQKGVLVVCVFQLAWSLAGFIAEPSFDFGDGEPEEAAPVGDARRRQTSHVRT